MRKSSDEVRIPDLGTSASGMPTLNLSLSRTDMKLTPSQEGLLISVLGKNSDVI